MLTGTDGCDGQILEDYEKQLQHLKKETEAIKLDFDEWDKEQNPQGSR